MITGNKDAIILIVCVQIAVLVLLIFFKMWLMFGIYVFYNILYSIFASLENNERHFKINDFKNLLLLQLPINVKYKINPNLEFVAECKTFRWIPLSIKWYGVSINSGHFTREIDDILTQRNLNVINEDGILSTYYYRHSEEFNRITQKDLNDRFKNFLVDIVKALKEKR